MSDTANDARLDLLDERLDHYRERIEALESELDDRSERRHIRRGHVLEIVVILLVALEALFEILLYLRHA